MKHLLTALGALTILTTAGANADTMGPRPFTKETQVVLVGQITSQPKDFIFDEDKMQVAVGPDRVKHTLHLSHAKIWNYNGIRIKDNHLVDKLWVRAEGKIMNDPRRIMVSRVEVIGRNLAEYARSPYYLRGLEPGYVQAVAGSREYFASTKPFPQGAHVVLLGEVKDRDGDRLRVVAGPDQREFTIHLDDASLTGYDGDRIRTRDLRDDMWVRAEGTVMKDGRRIQGTRVQVVGRDWGQYRHSSSFDGAEQGFIYEMIPPR